MENDTGITANCWNQKGKTLSHMRKNDPKDESLLVLNQPNRLWRNQTHTQPNLPP